MTKLGFLFALRDKLSGMPQSDIEERLNFYSEMIEDRIEEGLSEEEAVAEIGSVEKIAAQILGEASASKPIKQAPKSRRKFKVWEIVLLALGSPLWISLLIAALAVAISLYASLWAVIIAFWAVFGALAGTSFGIIVMGVGFAFNGKTLIGAAMIGAGIVCAGLSIFAFFGCKAATKGAVWLIKKIILSIKNRLSKKEEAQNEQKN